jgi:hypothetical protein
LLKDFNIFVWKFSSLLEFAALLLSFLVGLVWLGWLVAGDDEMGKGLVALVVVVGIEAAGIVCCCAVDGRSLIHTAPETKWYPCGHVPPGSDRSTIGTLVVVVAVTLLLLLPLPVFLDNCANGATDEVVVCGAAAEDASAGSIVLGIYIYVLQLY